MEIRISRPKEQVWPIVGLDSLLSHGLLSGKHARSMFRMTNNPTTSDCDYVS